MASSMAAKKRSPQPTRRKATRRARPLARAAVRTRVIGPSADVQRTSRTMRRAGFKNEILKEVARLRTEIQKLDTTLAPDLRKKRKYEEQIQPLLAYLRITEDSADQESHPRLPSITPGPTIDAHRALRPGPRSLATSPPSSTPRHDA